MLFKYDIYGALKGGVSVTGCLYIYIQYFLYPDYEPTADGTAASLPIF